MRIAILADAIDNQNAGIHVFAREMVEAMIRTNPGHEILLIREKRDPELKDTQQISIWNTRLPMGFASLRLFFIVPFILHRNKVDVVIEPAHFGPFNLLKHVKRVTVIHDLTPILFPELHRWHSQILQKIFLKSILNKAHLIITNSDNTSRDVCKVYPQNCKKVKRIYPGISKIFKPENKPGVLEKYNISGSYFLFVGTIEPRKNLLVLLEAFRIFLQGSKISCTLVIAGGTGWKSEPFFQALNNHPYKEQIRVTGFVETADLPTLYSQAVALIYPSYYEGFGLPVVEAMSCGTPVIAADNSSLPESGGSFTRYFDAKDSETLARHMSELSSDVTLKGKLLNPLREHVKKFNWDVFAREAWTSIVSLKL
jgi:glycosyltransferase involved in cell wall biosynthesis